MEERDYLDEVIELRANEPGMDKAMAEAELRQSLVEMRHSAGLSQYQVAERMGLPQSRIAEIERKPGRVSFDRIQSYVKAVNGTIVLLPTRETPKQRAKPRRNLALG